MCIYKIKKKDEVIKEYQELNIVDNNQNKLYISSMGNCYNNINDDIYVDILGNIYGDIYSNIYGDIQGDIYGDIYGNIYGDIYGNVWGEQYGKVYGHVKSPNNRIDEGSKNEGIEGAIRKYYRKVYSKEIKDSLLKEYEEQIKKEEMTFEEVIFDILNVKVYTEKYESSESYITQLYLELLDRSMAKSEFDDWIHALQNGMTREAILEQFIFSEEFKEQYKKIDKD